MECAKEEEVEDEENNSSVFQIHDAIGSDAKCRQGICWNIWENYECEIRYEYFTNGL